MDAKLKAIVSHITPIGWIIALVINSGNKEEYASYYIRQNLGLILVGIALGIVGVIPVLGWIIDIVGSVILFIFWLMSLIWSVSGEMKPVPWLGTAFQTWFKNL
jgi:hypothetical protein